MLLELKADGARGRGAVSLLGHPVRLYKAHLAWPVPGQAVLSIPELPTQAPTQGLGPRRALRRQSPSSLSPANLCQCSALHCHLLRLF